MSAPQPPTGPYAFVSYASADRARVLPVVAALRAAGVLVWLDEQGIAGGENYAREIAEAIKGAAAFLLLASPASLASRNVKQEVALAWRYERPYVPLRLDPVAIPDDLAYWLEAAQWVDVLDRQAEVWLPAVLAALAPLGIAPPPPAAAPPEPLAGRAREQALLRERLTAALAGHGGLVLVGGEAGVGKTTLAEATLAEAAEQGALALVGRCYDLSDTPPYGPWVDLFGRYRPGPGDPPPPPAFAERGTVGAVASQAALARQVADFLAAAATRRPLTLLLDDLHWADPASLDLLRAVARDLTNLPALLLVTYRSDELTRRHPLYALLPLLDREASAVRLDLRRFDTRAVGDLVAARYALSAADVARLVAWLHGRTEGNAFFTAQLLRALEDEGLLHQADSRWALGDLGAVGLPAALRQVLDGRLARLGEGAQRQLTVAAVIGAAVPLALWASVAETDEDGLLDTIEQAVDARLLTESPDGSAARFAHALIREALYEGLLATRRRRVHRTVAENLATTTSPDPDAVAYHFRQAGDARAVTWLVRAGDRAQRAYALLSAAERFEAALALLERRDASARERGWLLLRLARVRRASAPQEGLRCLDEARGIAAALQDATLAAYVLTNRGMLLTYAGARSAGIAELTRGVAALDALAPPDRARLRELQEFIGDPCDAYPYRGTLALFLVGDGRFAEARALAERAIADAPTEMATSGVGASFIADAYFGLGQAHAALGHPTEARHAFARASEHYRAVGHHFNVASTFLEELLAAVAYQADAPAELRRLADRAVAAEARSQGARTDVPLGICHLPVLVLAGDWTAARALALAARPSRLQLPIRALAILTRAQGDTDLGWELVRDWLPAGPATTPNAARFTSFLVVLQLQRLAAALALDAGDLPHSRAWLAANDHWLATSGALLERAEGHLGWSTYHRVAGDPAQARAQAETGLAQATAPRQPLALLAAHRTLGELDIEAGQYDDAAAHLAESLALADACAAPYARALTLLARAELRAATGDRPAARADLAAVTAICAPLEARPALARADALAARLGDAG